MIIAERAPISYHNKLFTYLAISIVYFVTNIPNLWSEVLFENFPNKFIIYGEELLVSRPTLKLEYHPLSALRDCLFNIFAATLHTWRVSPPSAT
jgi:hypothetical protein